MKQHTRFALGSVALATMLLAAGCTAPGTDTDTDTPTGDLSEAAQAAQAIVDEVSQPVAEFVAPGPEIDASGLAGKTVYYIVPDTSIAIFQKIDGFLTEALGELDITVQQCGTQGTSPDGVANCLSQAIDAQAAAVVTGAIPRVIAPTAFDAVIAAGIPVLYTLAEPTGPEDPTKVGYFTPDTVKLQAWNATWIIADSNGEANVLVGQETDNPVVSSWTDLGTIATYDANCPDCTYKVIASAMSNADKIPTDVTTSLLADPSIDYVQAPFDSHVVPIMQGVQGASRTPADIKMVSSDASLAVIQQLAQGQFISAASGFSVKAFSWYAADEVLRMLTGNPSNAVDEFPYMRLFTADNVGDLTLTEEAWQDGSWYGSPDFTDEFLALWGVN